MKFQEKIIFILTLFIIAYKCIIANSIADADLWHRLAVGKIFFELGSIIKHDIFSYVPTKDLWIDHEWGSGIIFYFLADHLGDYGLLGLKFLVFATVLYLIYTTNKLISGKKDDLRIGFYAVVLLTVMFGFINTVRCHIFTYLFFALWIYILERIRRGETRLIWIFPATMLFWVNMHGGFLAGLGLLFLYMIGEFLNKKNFIKYAGALILSLLVTFINPYGWNMWHYIVNAVGMPRPYVIEWLPIFSVNDFQIFIAFEILLFITFVGYVYKFAVKDKEIDWVAILVILATLALSIKHLRHQVFFGIAAGIFSQHHYFYEAVKSLFQRILAKFTDNLPQKEPKQYSFIKIAIINTFILFFCAYYVFMNPLNIRATEPEYPAKAVEFIRINNLKGNLLTSFNWGSYALWKLYPQVLIFEDGRYEEVYMKDSTSALNKFFFEKENWQNILTQYHHDIILIDNNFEVLNKLKSLNNWKIVYQDRNSTVFIPASMKNNWILPGKDSDYNKTKYLNKIEF